MDDKGRILFRRDGEKEYVRFSNDETLRMKDNIITHNHPSGVTNPYKIGASFSVNDLTLAVSTNAKEVRAVKIKETI